MATKRIKRAATPAAPAQKGQQIWLAGLGAVSLVQQRGEHALARLVQEGKVVQTRTEKFARELSRDTRAQVQGALAPIAARVRRDAEKVGIGVQQGVAVVLGKLGIPSKADIDELTTRVTALSRQLKSAR